MTATQRTKELTAIPDNTGVVIMAGLLLAEVLNELLTENRAISQ